MKKFLVCLTAVALGVSARADSFSFQPSDRDLGDLDHGNAYTWGISGSDGPSGADENALSHQLQSGYTITSATLTISHIYNWDRRDTSNKLFIHLLNDPLSGVRTISDDPNDNGINQGTVSDYFDKTASGNQLPGHWHWGHWVEGDWVAYGLDSDGDPLSGNYENTHLGDYHDNDGPNHTDNFTYTFSTAELAILEGYINDGDNGGRTVDFGFGFDPDCHFYNNGVCFTVTTAHYSVPDTAMTYMLLGLGLAGLAGCKRFILRA
jgi:hypothetical protein